ncbi:4212a482-96a7-422d-a9ec-35f135570af6 [Sclerotinia trifoliorum]|uniref:4212a482-96a7-422d-a9ec-35f135570af6 n=1 Tax=Sclerotinia trifoliorum TaxID=28548 RepID=A0A8H2VPD7_9HELO|nr:4212a482-96a7-422d-a9ec-35f135570af6 [Sclerotinia trifoliorum]
MFSSDQFIMSGNMKDCEDLALTEGFLDQESTESGKRALKHKHNQYSRSSICLSQKSFWPWIHIFLIFNYTVLFSLAILKFSRNAIHLQPPEELLHLSARSAIEWEVRKFETKILGNPFVGEPRPELENAWHNLLRYDNLQVPLSDFDENMPVIHLKDGSGVIAQLTVFHALHCLKKLRQWVYRNHYYSTASEDRLSLESEHADHCIEYIREHLMCKPDISLITYKWVNGTRGNEVIGQSKSLRPSNKDLSDHECVNWDNVDAWAGEREFDLFRVDLLKRPDPVS